MSPVAAPLTLGSVARHFGVPIWKVRRIYERKILPEPARIGNYRVVHQDDLPCLEHALVEAGYLESAEVSLAE